MDQIDKILPSFLCDFVSIPTLNEAFIAYIISKQ